jgi:hypothetical protein
MVIALAGLFAGGLPIFAGFCRYSQVFVGVCRSLPFFADLSC